MMLSDGPIGRYQVTSSARQFRLFVFQWSLPVFDDSQRTVQLRLED